MNPAKRYSNAKYLLSIIDTFYLLSFLFLFLISGLSKSLFWQISRWQINGHLALPVYILLVYLGYYCLNFPLNIYQSFILEHRFGLTKQKIGDWLKDQFKSSLIAYIIIFILAAAFYFLLDNFKYSWWLLVSFFWIFFSIIFTRLFPVLIIPLFFKYRRINDDNLRVRILDLAKKAGIKILDVFEIDFSKKTFKANAAFLGWGKSRRVLLADTLRDKYTAEEIEVILVHEFAHYRMHHLWKLILVNSCATIALFYLIYRTQDLTLRIFGLSSLNDIASLPLVLIYFVLFGIFIQPFSNYISRGFERQADREAISLTDNKSAFISMMNKLAEQNLADRKPHLLIKFFFFDHPPIDERIASATQF